MFCDGLEGLANFADVAGFDLAAVDGERDGERVGGVCKDAVRALAARFRETILSGQYDHIVEAPGSVALEAGEFVEEFATAAYAVISRA